MEGFFMLLLLNDYFMMIQNKSNYYFSGMSEVVINCSDIKASK